MKDSMKTSGGTSDMVNRGRYGTSPTRWDILLLMVLILLTVASVFAFRLTKSQGTDIWISVDGRPVGFYPLNEDRTIKVKGPIGITVVRIHNGQAAIIEAPCPHKLCQKMGPIPSHGDVMICIPNRIIVEIKGGKGRETDAITR